MSGGNIFAGTNGGVFLSTNNGTSWIAINSGLTNTPVNCLAVSGSSIFAGIYGRGVFLSTNDGTSWKAVDSGLPAQAPIGQASWSAQCFAVNGTNIFAGIANSIGHVYLSTDNGTSWTAVNSLNPVDAGLGMGNVMACAVSGNDIFAGTDNWGIWRRPLSEMVSVVPQNRQTSPLQTRLRIVASGSLHSGFMLNYSIRSRCIVQLDICTIAGKQVALLEQGERAPGEYALKFDTGRVPAGIYVCRFQAGSYQESNRLMVVK